MSINLKVLIVALSIWTAAAIREHVVKSHDPRPANPVVAVDSAQADSVR